MVHSNTKSSSTLSETSMASGYLNGRKTYLCGAINASADDGVKWRDQITPELLSLGIEVLDPCKKDSNNISEIGEAKKVQRELILNENWSGLKEEFWPVVRGDLRCVDHSDFVIFNYDHPEITTIGSVHELVVAVWEKKPILLKYNKDTLNAFNPWISTYIKVDHFFSDWDKMIEYLKNVDGGSFDTSLWVL